MRPSATEGPATQAAAVSSPAPTRVVVVLVDVMPRKSAKVKSEFTLTMPSNAMMWMLVVVILRRRDTSELDISGEPVEAEKGKGKEEKED